MVATADVVWSKEMEASAFYLMCSAIKTRGSGVVSVFLYTQLSLTRLLPPSRTHDSNEGIIAATARPSAFWLLPSLPRLCTVNANAGLCAEERAGVVKSLICTSWNSHKSPAPLHPRSPPPTQFPGQHSAEYEARLVHCDSIWLSAQSVPRLLFFVYFK